MTRFGPPLFGFVVAGILAWVELVTSRYPRTFTFIRTSPALYSYCFIYGIIGFAVLFGFDALVSAGVLKAEGLGLSNPWIRAFEIGVAVKALLHIRLFTVTAGSQPFPVGIESLVQLFEPWLLDRVEQDEFNEKSSYIEQKRHEYPEVTVKQFKVRLSAATRPSLSQKERSAIAIDIANALTADEAMTIYLDRFGRRTLDRLYPSRSRKHD